MDFLEIRRKAKQRADARARRGGTATPPARGKPRAARRRGRGRAPPDDPVVTDADVVEGALIAEMQGRSAARDDFVIVRGPPPAPPGGEGPAPVPGGLAGPGASGSQTSPRGPAVDAGQPPDDPLAEFFLGDEEAAPAGTGPAPAEDRAEALREVLMFTLGGEEYALEIGTVREILKAPPIIDVPRAPPHILGVTMVRGQVIAVYDPRRRLGLPPAKAGPGARVVVCDAGSGPVGLLVDGVSQVLRLEPSALEPRPQGIAGVDSEFIAGVGRGEKRLFALLDAAALLRRDPATGGAR